MKDDIFKWDPYSDQPYPIRDKALRKEIYKKTLYANIKLLLTNLLLSPIILLAYPFTKYKRLDSLDRFFGMGISLGDDIELIRELGIKDLFIRIPLSDIDDLEKYKEYINSLAEFRVVGNILQDRSHIKDQDLLKRDIKKIFKTLPLRSYQIANAINRKKWAFFSMDEYLGFYKTIQDIRDESFQDIKLYGSSVIDFEYHYTIRTLFNLYKIRYDRFSSLLYVDRRGSPENKQLGFDLRSKIRLLYTLLRLSKKSPSKIVITETNWPIIDTAPYAPTSQKECVDLDSYTLYMILYHLLAISTGMVETIYWHQLIAKGYGLIDETNQKKYPSFQAYKIMVKLLKDKRLIEYDLSGDKRYMHFRGLHESLKIYWSYKGLDIKEDAKILNIYGKEYSGENFAYILSDLV